MVATRWHGTPLGLPDPSGHSVRLLPLLGLALAASTYFAEEMGIEPTSLFRDELLSRESPAPSIGWLLLVRALSRDRTYGQLLRRQLLYPLSYEGMLADQSSLAVTRRVYCTVYRGIRSSGDEPPAINGHSSCTRGQHFGLTSAPDWSRTSDPRFRKPMLFL